jgi:hypothetical protein
MIEQVDFHYQKLLYWAEIKHHLFNITNTIYNLSFIIIVNIRIENTIKSFISYKLLMEPFIFLSFLFFKIFKLTQWRLKASIQK